MRYNSRNAKLLFDSGYQPQVSAVQTPPSSRIALGPAIPNPFNPSTTLSFNISIPGPVLISVHDLNGRRIRVLLDENRQSGSHQVTWDGRDGSGRTVASGTYFVRLSSGGASSVAKVVLSK
jgi:flagellar hook assembly protein FlgD